MYTLHVCLLNPLSRYTCVHIPAYTSVYIHTRACLCLQLYMICRLFRFWNLRFERPALTVSQVFSFSVLIGGSAKTGAHFLLIGGSACFASGQR